MLVNKKKCQKKYFRKNVQILKQKISQEPYKFYHQKGQNCLKNIIARHNLQKDQACYFPHIPLSKKKPQKDPHQTTRWWFSLRMGKTRMKEAACSDTQDSDVIFFPQ